MTASDSGIGPEEVTAALESMILGLKALEDDVWPTYPADTPAEPDAGDIRKGAITPGIYMIDSSEKQTITHADRPSNQTTETEAIPSRADAVSNMQAASFPDTVSFVDLQYSNRLPANYVDPIIVWKAT